MLITQLQSYVVKFLPYAIIYFALVCTAMPSGSAESDERRLRSGLKQFKSVLAADRDLKRKKTVDDKLHVLMVYRNDIDNALLLAEELVQKQPGGGVAAIRKMQIKATVVSISELAKFSDKRIAGVYLTQSLSQEGLKRLVDYGVDKKLIVYSPFEGDVHRGVVMGMSIGTRLYPLININTMEASGLRIKKFFFKVAKKYEN